jgi:hypothetical protein
MTLNNFIDKPNKDTYKPPKSSYIIAWCIGAFVSNILTSILSAFVDIDNSSAAFIIFVILLVPIYAGTFILVYNFFSLLNIKRVMPYFYISNGLVVLYCWSVYGLPIFIVILISLYTLVPTYIIRAYFRKNPKRWY